MSQIPSPGMRHSVGVLQHLETSSGRRRRNPGVEFCDSTLYRMGKMVDRTKDAVDTEPHYLGVPPELLPTVQRNPVHVVLENIRSAFNVGSIFRTADAGAVERIHLCGYTCHPPNEKLAKTALGATDYVPWTRHVDGPSALASLRAAGVTLAAIEVVDDAIPHTRFEWPQPVAIVFGNEVYGITEETLGACDVTIQIPMRGYKNTINVATAFGIVLYEILRQWNAV